MKKTVIIIAIALGFSVTSLNAKNTVANLSNYEKVISKVTVSPFCTSIAKGDFETVKKLIELGADVNKKSNGMTPLMYAAKYNRVEIIKLLVEQGAKIDAKSDSGHTAFKYAEMSNAQDALKTISHLEKNS